jgi:hypothetical protein
MTHTAALRSQVIVTVAPVEWRMDASCPGCGQTWRIEGGAR